MIRTISGDNVRKYTGLSTDTKPLDCWGGSSFIEIDTGKVYLFDEANGSWEEYTGSNIIISI